MALHRLCRKVLIPFKNESITGHVSLKNQAPRHATLLLLSLPLSLPVSLILFLSLVEVRLRLCCSPIHQYRQTECLDLPRLRF